MKTPLGRPLSFPNGTVTPEGAAAAGGILKLSPLWRQLTTRWEIR
jgi:hypothetical protein